MCVCEKRERERERESDFVHETLSTTGTMTAMMMWPSYADDENDDENSDDNN